MIGGELTAHFPRKSAEREGFELWQAAFSNAVMLLVFRR
jgi:hypothetical protein